MINHNSPLIALLEFFSKLTPPNSVYKDEKAFHKIVNNISKKCIPSGRIIETISNIPTEAALKIKSRDQICTIDPHSPQIAELNLEIETLIKDHKQEKWRTLVGNIERKTDSGKLFKLIKNLNGQPQSKNNSAIRFKGKYLLNPLKIADSFNNQFSSVVRHTSSKESRNITRDLRNHSLANTNNFTAEETTKAIKQSKSSKALGPDHISNLHLKHLGPAGIQYLTHIYNLSMSTSQLPSIWKTSIIIPLPKPGKDHSESTSFRPVSLLCPSVKVLERLILPTLNEHLNIPDFQHGFRSNHSTVSALNDLNQDIIEGFTQKKPASQLYFSR